MNQKSLTLDLTVVHLRNHFILVFGNFYLNVSILECCVFGSSNDFLFDLENSIDILTLNLFPFFLICLGHATSNSLNQQKSDKFTILG